MTVCVCVGEKIRIIPSSKENHSAIPGQTFRRWLVTVSPFSGSGSLSLPSVQCQHGRNVSAGPVAQVPQTQRVQAPGYFHPRKTVTLPRGVLARIRLDFCAGTTAQAWGSPLLLITSIPLAASASSKIKCKRLTELLRSKEANRGLLWIGRMEFVNVRVITSGSDQARLALVTHHNSPKAENASSLLSPNNS